ncbi:hypothetical protein FRB96_005776 [Tulasnella sp. 330]|nr:hypothetical protein FRB96_005776 [Tulasnella sp. 330]KAG8870953.1 hypothetical protein FRB97_009223 [Tulasnella sp. 331]
MSMTTAKPDMRPIYIIVYHSPLFPAHWSLWIPSAANPNVGKVIHVNGSAASGFEREFRRNFDIKSITQKHSLILLAQVDEKYITDTPEDGLGTSDEVAVDGIETVALKLAPPEKSLRVSNAAKEVGTGRVQLLNCQTWLRELVILLAAESIVSDSAMSVMDSVPKN